MAISATAVIEGTVSKVSVRDVVSKSNGEKYQFKNVLVIGDNTLADVRVPDSVAMPALGDVIAARVKIGSFRNEAQFEIEELLD